MPRIVFIGAGSVGFTRSLVIDLLTFPLLKDSTIVLMDIDKDRLDWAKKSVQILIDRFKQIPGYTGNPKLEATLDRKKALKGADFVLCTILMGGPKIFKYDLAIPKKYGVDFSVGDTRDVSGIFRALRTIPVMVDICRDIERLCPNAVFLNYTNPMAMLCRAMQKATPVNVTGLCHGVQGTAMMLATWLENKDKPEDIVKSDMSRISYVCAGINHQAWFLQYKKDGKDAYPLIRKAIKNEKIWRREPVRNEMFVKLNYYMTESSGHSSEYNWWFRKRQSLIDEICYPGTYWNNKYGLLIGGFQMDGKEKKKQKEQKLSQQEKKKHLMDSLEGTKKMSLDRGFEYAVHIMNALVGGENFEFNGNVPNTGLIPNLPPNTCVEVPVVANSRGLNPLYVGPLPPQCAVLNNVNIACEEMAVEAALTGKKDLVYYAAYHSPLTASVLSLPEIENMVTEMFSKNKEYLPHFKGIK
jgi:alpha-galactosidase